MKKRAQYIVFEGVEGVGKTTQTNLLVEELRKLGYKVLQTKEPGTDHLPITLRMRELMLSNEFDTQLSKSAREFISQAIRSVHLEKLIAASIHEYDFIIQDRGILSGYAYGVACGNDFEDLRRMTKINMMGLFSASNHAFYPEVQYIPESIYDRVVLLTGNVQNGLSNAIQSKKEFLLGDAMESRGVGFMENTAALMSAYSDMFNTVKISVDSKSIEQVQKEILYNLGVGTKK